MSTNPEVIDTKQTYDSAYEVNHLLLSPIEHGAKPVIENVDFGHGSRAQMDSKI